MANNKSRFFVSDLLIQVLTNQMSVLQAASAFPKDTNDPSIDAAFHALMHMEADEDFRSKDALYKEEQDSFIEFIAQTLAKGDDLAENIIDEYTKFYPEAMLYKPDTKENIIKRLLKSINL